MPGCRWSPPASTDLCAALNSPRGQPDLRSDAAHAQSSKRAQQLVDSIRQSAADIQMEAAALGTASVCAGGKMRVGEAMKSAQANQDEVRRLLASATISGGGSFSDSHLQQSWQSTVEKSVADAFSAVTDASREYKAAEKERKRRDNAAAAAVLDAELACSAEQGLQAVARVVPDVSQAEVETHAAFAEDYARDAVRLGTNVRQINQVVTDLAQITTDQADSVSNILSIIESASESARDASREVAQTDEQQRGSTKRMLILITFAILLVALIIVVVVLKYSR